MRPLNWFLDGLVSLFHLVFAPWPEGEPDPSDLPRWARALIGATFIVILVAGVVWFLSGPDRRSEPTISALAGANTLRGLRPKTHPR